MWKEGEFPEVMDCRWTYLPLGGKVAISSGDAEEEGVERGEICRSDRGVIRFGRSVHFREGLLGECFRDPL